MSHAYHIITKDHFNRPVEKLNHFGLKDLNNASAAIWKVFGGKKWDEKVEQRRIANNEKIETTKVGQVLDGAIKVGNTLALALAGSKAGTSIPGVGTGNYQNNTAPPPPQQPTFEEKLQANALPIAGGLGIFLFILILIAAFR